MINHNYERVVPRDLFNEAKLLKCMGMLCLLITDKILPEEVRIIESREPFKILQDTSDGSISIANYHVYINDIPFKFETKLNSRNPYPLYCIDHYHDDDIQVFDHDGTISKEFDKFIEYMVS